MSRSMSTRRTFAILIAATVGSWALIAFLVSVVVMVVR